MTDQEIHTQHCSSTGSFNGMYGASQAPCKVLFFGYWYAIKGSRNVNRAPKCFCWAEGMVSSYDTETIHDVDAKTSADPIETLQDLVDILGVNGQVRHNKNTIGHGVECEGGFRITKISRNRNLVTIFKANTVDVGSRFAMRPMQYRWDEETQGYRRKGGGENWMYLNRKLS